MAITDLTNTKWLFNEDLIREGTPAWQYNINFKSNNSNYVALSYYKLVSTVSHYMLSYHPSSGAPITVFNGDASSTPGTWVNQAYKLIEITGGTDVTNSTLISWLEANAIQIIPVPDAKKLVTYEDLDEFKNQILSIVLKYRCGYYDPNLMYNVGDSVFYNKRIYVCISNTLGGVPPTNITYWIPLVVNE